MVFNKLLFFTHNRFRWHHLLKGNFLQGKRNRRLDHLLYVLVKVAVPYFIQRHRRQAFGFEGPDLEARRRIEIEERAKSIPLSTIAHETDEPGSQVFLVQSQSTPNVRYCVDLQAYDCECVSFPAICFCKHICAVQTYFPDDDCKLVPTSMLTIHCPDSFEAEVNASDSGDDSEDGGDRSPQKPKQAEPPITLKNIITTLSSLAIRLQANPPSTTPDSLLKLHDDAKGLLVELDRSDTALLPPMKKVAPNQHSWSETATVMNVRVKSKRKAHLDPYGGGERPGKKAKLDARSSALEPWPSSTPAPLISTPQHLGTPPIPLVHPQSPPAPIHSILSQRGTSLATGIPSILHPTLPVITPFIHTAQFDPATFNLKNKFALYSLKRAQLNQLCSYHKLKANGTNEAVISRLEACIPP